LAVVLIGEIEGLGKTTTTPIDVRGRSFERLCKYWIERKALGVGVGIGIGVTLGAVEVSGSFGVLENIRLE
jgi:hypothetical protein